MIVDQQRRYKSRWAPCGRRERLQDYYVVRESVQDYGDYFGCKLDPDGKPRDRLSDEERRQFVEDVGYLIERVNERQPRTVLDFGSGPGWLLGAIDAPCKTAVEIAPQACERLFLEGYLLRSDLADVDTHSQDVVIAHHVFEHLADPLYHLTHCRRVLKHDGLFVLATPDFASPCAMRFGPRYRMLHDPTHCSLFTLESCSRMLRDWGFEIIGIEFPFPERLATLETFLRWHDRVGVSPPWPGNWMTFFCGRHH